MCRRYRADPVPEALVRLLCATALAAPTKSDLQQATLVRVADPAKRAAICSLLPGSPWLAQAPELFVFCADGWRPRRLFARRGREFPNEHLDASKVRQYSTPWRADFGAFVERKRFRLV